MDDEIEDRFAQIEERLDQVEAQANAVQLLLLSHIVATAHESDHVAESTFQMAERQAELDKLRAIDGSNDYLAGMIASLRKVLAPG